MPSYLYKCDSEKEHEFEEFHSIKISMEDEDCPKCIEEKNSPIGKLKRLIAAGTSFVLQGRGWAKDRYS